VGRRRLAPGPGRHRAAVGHRHRAGPQCRSCVPVDAWEPSTPCECPRASGRR
jgi:hypothetical protein